MLVTLEYTDRVTLDLQVRQLKFGSAAARQFGQAEIWIPATSSAFAEAYIGRRGGGYVRVDSALGRWEGFAQPPQRSERGIVLKAYELGWLLTSRLVARNRTFTAQTAGVIVRQALEDALAGLGRPVLRIGTIVEAAPAISTYAFTGQYASQVIADMQEATGSEWGITNGAFNWLPPVSTAYEYQLTEDGDVIGGVLSGTLDDQAAEVIGRDAEGREFSVRDGGLFGSSFWQRQMLVTYDGEQRANLALATETTLAAHRAPSQTFTVGLRARALYDAADTTLTGDEIARGLAVSGIAIRHWSTIREGAVLALHLPHTGYPGASFVGRVLSRTYTEGSPTLQLELQWLPPTSPTSAMRLEALRAVPQHTITAEHDVARRLLAQGAAIRQLQTA